MADAPWPLIEVCVAPAPDADIDGLAARLVAVRIAGCTVRLRSDSGSQYIVLGGTTETDLDSFVTHLRHVGIVLDFRAPQVAYRETLTKRVAIDYVHKKQSGGSGRFAKVHIAFEPDARGAGNPFQSRIGGSMPFEYVTSIRRGIASAMSKGTIHDFPVIDVKATLLDGAWHEIDSPPQAFEDAAYAATREAITKGAPILLEPIMRIEVVTPEEYKGSVIGDLRSRRGQILGESTHDGTLTASALVPLANLFGYPNQLRALSRGRGVVTMTFAEYRPFPSGDDGPFPMAAALRA